MQDSRDLVADSSPNITPYLNLALAVLPLRHTRQLLGLGKLTLLRVMGAMLTLRQRRRPRSGIGEHPSAALRRQADDWEARTVPGMQVFTYHILHTVVHFDGPERLGHRRLPRGETDETSNISKQGLNCVRGDLCEP